MDLSARIKKAVHGKIPGGGSSVDVLVEDGVIILVGDVSSLEERLAAGFGAAKVEKRFGLRGVVNDLTVRGRSGEPMRLPEIRDRILDNRSFDVVIIGGGVIGAAAARELSRRQLSIALLEKEEDLGLHASSRNDGMIHPGIAPKPKTLKARYNVRGNALYSRAAEELGFVLKRPGSIFLFSSPLLKLLVPYLKRRCRRNGVDGRYLNRRTVADWEPSLGVDQHGGFYLPSAGIVSPQDVVLAYGENAAANGVEFFFHTAVIGFERKENRITEVRTNRGTLRARIVINAAGLWSDKIAAMAGDRFFSIHPRKGVDAILDKRKGSSVSHILGMPSLGGSKKSRSKGGGLVPCVEGNLLLGPTAEEVLDREDYSTRRGDLEGLKVHMKLDSLLESGDIITYYAGTRAATWEEDFVVQASDRVDNLIHGAGIQSPGFASAPAIAEELAALAVEKLRTRGEVEPNGAFNPRRRGRPPAAELTDEERARLIAGDPAYGRIVCRCEGISEGEIRDALWGPLHAPSVDGVKRRTRAGAGRCHGGFCMPRVMEIMARERGVSLAEIVKNGTGSWILTEREAADGQ